MRLRADGTPDPSFGQRGRVEDTPFRIWRLYAIAGDELLALGEGAHGIGVERYTDRGVPERSFGRHGVRWLAAPQQPVNATLDRAGRILVLGRTLAKRIEVERFLASGSPDARFGAHGVAILHGLSETEPIALATQPDGSVIVTGAMAPQSQPSKSMPPRAFLARLRPSGVLDPSFGQGGIVRTPIAAGGLTVAVAPDRGILLAAGESSEGSPRQEGLLLARYTSAGRLDPSFGEKGIARSLLFSTTSPFRGGSVEPRAIAFDALVTRSSPENIS